MAANNETGALQPIAEAAEIVHQAGGLLHVDAIQAFAKIPFNISEVGADLATLSAHKIGGPKGVGALVLAEAAERGWNRCCAAAVRNGAAGPEPKMSRGSPDSGPRRGLPSGAPAQDRSRLETLRDRLELGLRETPDVLIFSREVSRLPNTTLFTAPGLQAETAVIGFDLEGVAVSSGSACSSGKVQPSHVLQAMGFGPEQAIGAVRLSLGWSTTDADIDRCLQAWRKLAGTLVKGEPRNPA